MTIHPNQISTVSEMLPVTISHLKCSVQKMVLRSSEHKHYHAMIIWSPWFKSKESCVKNVYKSLTSWLHLMNNSSYYVKATGWSNVIKKKVKVWRKKRITDDYIKCQVLIWCAIFSVVCPLKHSKQFESNRDGKQNDSKQPNVSICTTHPLRRI